MTNKIIHLIIGARPNYMKVAPLFHHLKINHPRLVPVLKATGQHFDSSMSEAFLTDFNLPRPDFQLDIGQGTPIEQIAKIMTRYEALCLENRPDLTIVAGDVNSALAVAIAAKKMNIPLAHLESGLRSFDRAMPEEINRTLIDTISDVLWTPSLDANENLANEGITENLHFVGNIMIDAFEFLRNKISTVDMLSQYGLNKMSYAVTTLHRPSNVDNKEMLLNFTRELKKVCSAITVVFPIHPRTKKQLIHFGMYEELKTIPSLILIEPLGYIQFMSLVVNSAVVITDSGGIQEETSYLGIPCLTVRKSTERPITLTEGTNKLIEFHEIYPEVLTILKNNTRIKTEIKFWDGKTSERIGNCLEEILFQQNCVSV